MPLSAEVSSVGMVKRDKGSNSTSREGRVFEVDDSLNNSTIFRFY